MNRIISIGLAIAVAPAILLAIGQWIESPDLVYVAQVALFDIALPLGGLLVIAGLLKKRMPPVSLLAKAPATQTALHTTRRLWESSIAGLTSTSAQMFDEVYTKLFWAPLIGLVAFTVAFGSPFIGTVSSTKVLAMAGCTPPGFDAPAVCPPGSFATRFVLLTGWTKFVLFAPLLPLIFIQQFWDVLLGWSLVTLAFYFKSGKWSRQKE